MSERTLLLVDDEPHVINALRRLLRQEQYTILSATNGGEGLSLLEKHPIQLIVSDQRMPEMTGTEFLERVKKGYPDTLRVVLSGYADVGVILDAINKGAIFRFLTKPWNDDELKVALRQCFAHYDLVQQNKNLVQQVEAQNDELKQLNDGLEQAVTERTRSLQLSQEILERLPTPVLGISTEGIIVLANAVSRSALPMLKGIVMGANIHDILPPDVALLIEDCLKEGTRQHRSDFVLAERRVLLQALPLGSAKQVRGCVLIVDGRMHGEW